MTELIMKGLTGADGTNPKLAGDLRKRTGAAPDILIDLHIADLLPAGTKAVRKATSAYKLNEEDIKQLTGTVVNRVKDVI